VLGVFDNINPTGATRFVDNMLGGTLMRLVQDGMLGSRLGEVSLLPTPRQRLLADMVIFVGLGPIDSFGPRVLEIVAENLARVACAARLTSLTVVPLGSNAGLTPEQSLASFLSGFLQGLARSDPGHEFQMLQLCEFDASRYARLEHCLRQLAGQGFFANRNVSAVLRQAEVETEAREAALPPPDTVRDPIYLQVKTRSDEGGNSVLDYSVLTADGPTIETHARTITKRDTQIAGERLLRARTIDQDIGAALRELYMPMETQRLVTRHLENHPDQSVVVIHDKGSSVIPWEVLHFGNYCPAIEAGLSRRFMSSSPGIRARSNLPPNASLRVLLVVDPSGNLPEAADEGRALHELFERNQCEVDQLFQEQATKANILGSLSTVEYDILHYAGHAAFAVQAPGQSGVLCSDGMLVAKDVAQLTAAPQLVFLNGCESARIRRRGEGWEVDPEQKARTPREVLFEDLRHNISLAEMVLLGGVSNFIGTYWPVGDAAAARLSTTFYTGLLAGDPLGLALRNARKQTRDVSPRDWANYQHFGNPSYRLRQRMEGAAA
jgi:CHAT domain-containing protein